MKAFLASALLTLLLSNFQALWGNETFQFPNIRQPGQLDKITSQLEIGGDLLFTQDGKTQREKMNRKYNLAYEERTLEMAGPQKAARSVRHYDKAEAVFKQGDAGVKINLRDERKLIVAEIVEPSPVLFSPLGPLSQDELESIDILGNSLLLDRLLPDKPLAVGDSWKLSDKLVEQLLWLHNIGQNEVQSTLKEVTKEVARFELSGKVTGTFKGVASEIELKARYRYDRRLQRIDWLGMHVSERRSSSPQTDGADVQAQLQVQVFPVKSSDALSDAALKDIPLETTPELLQTTLQAKQGNWEITYDRDWNVYHYLLEKAEMHFLDRGEIVAQCSLSSLPKTDPAKLISLEAYQEELRNALDKNFGEFVTAGEAVTPAKYRLLRVVIRGKVSEIPMCWIYYHVADQQGRQAVFVVVLEDKYSERLADADKKLVESFRFLDPNTHSNSKLRDTK